jgi:hypothetical protein
MGKPTSIETLVNSSNQVPVAIDAISAGDNNIGNVDIASIAAGDNNIGNVDLASAIPAGANLIGRTSNTSETSAIYDGTTALTPKFAKANISASTTDGAIISAVASKKLRVIAWIAQPGGTATNVTFNTKPGGAGTAISALFACGANTPVGGGFNPVGWFETSSGEGLTATSGTGSTVGIQVVYVEV